MSWIVVVTWLLGVPTVGETRALNAHQMVIPVVIDDPPWDSGQDAWVEVTYQVHAAGAFIHEEIGERVWWIQDRALAILGATGLVLPTAVTGRASVWVVIRTQGDVLLEFEVYPRRDGVLLNQGVSLLNALGKSLPGLDATYLAQVAHFLAGNLATLDVQGTSYSVAGIGPVISSNGDWVGGRLDVLSTGESVFVGVGAGTANNDPFSQATAVGFNALEESTGSANTALGHYAAAENTVGSSNTAVGQGSLAQNQIGSGNTALGSNSLGGLNSGSFNTAIGHASLFLNASGYQNTAVGNAALAQNTDGYINTAIGVEALYLNRTGFGNLASGYRALYSNQTGDGNTAAGVSALTENINGEFNTAVGGQSLLRNTNGSLNSSLGKDALFENLSGDRNTAVGANALQHNTAGNYNTMVGAFAGPSAANPNLSNCTAIGDAAVVTASNQVRIGDVGITSIGGQVGWTSFSDGRYKTNVSEDVPGIAFIESLRPLTFRVDQASLKAEVQNDKPVTSPARKHTGFIAQEVERAANELGFEFSGVDVPTNEQSLYGLRYSQFVVPLVKAVQEQQAMIMELNSNQAALIDELSQLRNDIVELRRAM